MPGEVLIELRSVTVRHDTGGTILDDVSLSVRAGEILGLVFAHGGGKSTLLRVASGFFQPNEGEVLHRGRPYRDLRFEEEQRLQQRIGFVFQNGGLLVNTRVFDNVALPLRYHTALSEAEIEKKVIEALTLVGMAQQAQRFPWELSTARQKLVTLARAVVREPEVVLYDNFVTGTEVTVWETMNRVVRTLRTTRKIAFLLVLEPDPECYKIADRICIIEDGKVVAIADPREMERSSDQRISRVFKTASFDPHDTNPGA